MNALANELFSNAESHGAHRTPHNVLIVNKHKLHVLTQSVCLEVLHILDNQM